MVSQTERITAVSVVVSQLNDLAAAFNEQHRALDRAAFRDLCRQLHEPLNAVLKLGIADKSIEQAIRKSFGYERSDPPTPNTKGCITIDLAMVFLSDDPKADSVLELVGYNELHDWVEESQGEIELIARKEVLKPGRIAESSLGPVMPTYYRHEDGSLSDLTPRMYAKFCKAIIEVLKLPLQENTQPGGEEQHDAPKQRKIIHTPAAIPHALNPIFETFEEKANSSGVNIKDYEWLAISLYVEPPKLGRNKKPRKNRPRKPIVEKFHKGDEVPKVTTFTAKRLRDLINSTGNWHRDLESVDTDYYEFMRKFLEWKLSAKVTQKVTR